MNEDNPAENETEPKSFQNETENYTNKSANSKYISKSNAILSANKNDAQIKDVTLNINEPNENINEAPQSDNKVVAQNTDILLDIEDTTGVNFKTDNNTKPLTYAEYGNQIRPPPNTWVFFQGGAALPDSQSPLDYDPSSRNSFVALVMGIVVVMILITSAIVAFVIFHEDAREWFQINGMILAIPAMILMIGLNYAIACSGCARVFPCNIICLVLAVIGMSIICAYVTVRYDTRVVFYAVLATTMVVMVCMLLAFSSFDFTSYMLYIVVIAAAFGAIALVASLTMLISGTYMKMVHLGMLIVGTLINVVILAMELQMILGGRTIEIGESDYALAAFLLYTSIVDIFLKLVQMIGIFDQM